MNNQMTTYTASANDVKAQVQLIQEVMKSVMKKDEHYGVIPGTQKDTLFQSGAQKLLSTFRLGSEPEVINVDETDISVSYRVKVRLFSIVDGNTVGFGIGECSSLEDKYCWRKAVNKAEFDSTPENHKRLKHGVDYRSKSDYAIEQIRTNYKDVANTILKMATKRALIGAVLTATAAGDIFTQDLEDMEPHTRDSILDAEVYDKKTGEVKPNASLQEIRNGVTALGLKTFIKDGDLIVAGKTFPVKDMLTKMGFKYRKPDGAQYGETYMDVSGLESSDNQANPIDALKAELDKSGLAIDIKTSNGKSYAKVTNLDLNNSNAVNFVRQQGFLETQKGFVRDITNLMSA